MIPLFKVNMSQNAVERASKVLKSGYIGEGPVVKEFEDMLKVYFDWPYVVAVNSATSAEHLALHMLRKGLEGSEVLCTPLTCTATNWPVLLNGYDIKWVDVDPNTCNIDMDDCMRKLSRETGIIYVMHWGGYPVDYAKLEVVLDKCNDMYGFRPVVIEDCAHAFGSTYTYGESGKRCLGTFMNGYATYSFQAIKHVTSVDGGVLLCPNQESYERAKLLRWYGIDRESNRKDFRCEADIPEIGFKFHMNDVSAAVGTENLTAYDNAKRNKYCAEMYNQAFSWNKANIKLIPYNKGSAYWLYTMFVNRPTDFMARMKEAGIMVSRVHERNDKHSCVSQFTCALPNLDEVCKNMICIPCGSWITDDDLKYIIDTINKGW